MTAKTERPITEKATETAAGTMTLALQRALQECGVDINAYPPSRFTDHLALFALSGELVGLTVATESLRHAQALINSHPLVIALPQMAEPYKEGMDSATELVFDLLKATAEELVERLRAFRAAHPGPPEAEPKKEAE